MTGKSGFCKKFGDTDNVIRMMSIIYQKLLLKVGKAVMDLKFLYKCKNETVDPKFVRWKYVKDKPFRISK